MGSSPNYPPRDVADDAVNAERYHRLRTMTWQASPLAVVTSPRDNLKLGSMCLSHEKLDNFLDDLGLHDLFKSGDAAAPDSIKDRNGAVALAQCKRCGRAEAELSEPCTPPPTTPLTTAVTLLRDKYRIKRNVDYAVLERGGEVVVFGYEVIFDSVREVLQRHGVVIKSAFMVGERSW